ncbi:MAG TPA: DUF4405 domain-containing protein [Anaerolineae bacterium]|nr:DUF4405 domain-containing protein [Anaerolineae bacterium]
MKKAQMNYLVDSVILIAFVLSALSGLTFLAPLGWLNLEAATGPAFLGISLSLWNDLHTFASIALIAGVTLHLILHWTWILTMTKRTLGKHKMEVEDDCG